MKVLVLGGYGVFGGHLTRLLLGQNHHVVIAGRRTEPAQALAQELGCEWVQIESGASDLSARLKALNVEVVVDAAGPFQGYRSDAYRVARAAIASNAHYLDLSDDGAFTKGITELDHLAKETDVCVLSGVSSVPALSSAAAKALGKDIAQIEFIDTVICPGNRAPRGRSVMAAILGQVGAPMQVWRGNAWRDTVGWSHTRMVEIAPDIKRLASFIGAPDLVLFPNAFNARSVHFRAGLELGIMHRGLQALSLLRRKRLIPDLLNLLKPMHWVAKRLEPFGSDLGGMRVSVQGRVDGQAVERVFTCLAAAGVGPKIPAIPGLVAVNALAAGALKSGARPAVSELSLAALCEALHEIGVETTHSGLPAPRLFEQALGARWGQMPQPWRALHDVWDLSEFEGRAEVVRGTSWLSRLVAIPFGFPAAAKDVAVRVSMERRGASEVWTRNFAGKIFRSVLSPSSPNTLYERFGAFTFELGLRGDHTHLSLQVQRGWFLGIALPKWALPRSKVREDVQQGRFNFDVELHIPIAGFLVRYRGWLAEHSPPR